MVINKPVKLVVDCPALARWLTSNLCHASGPLALPWPKVPDDHKPRRSRRRASCCPTQAAAPPIEKRGTL
jgi:hypothetical protein